EKQLDVLGRANTQAGLGALLYKAAIQAERLRSGMFGDDGLPSGPAPATVSGTLNGQPFTSIEDADPRIGARLEVFAGGQYLWLPIEHVASLLMERPARLRDLLWSPAKLLTGPGFKGVELGEVLLPALTPLAATHPDPLVRLGRLTVWEELPDGRQVPAGQKLLLVDGEEVPILELRELVITPPAA
ncbi:MAG: type VI secretion system accessory protein TagJ, partial [Gemmatimonadaceae bacterium]